MAFVVLRYHIRFTDVCLLRDRRGLARCWRQMMCSDSTAQVVRQVRARYSRRRQWVSFPSGRTAAGGNIDPAVCGKQAGIC